LISFNIDKFSFASVIRFLIACTAQLNIEFRRLAIGNDGSHAPQADLTHPCNHRGLAFPLNRDFGLLFEQIRWEFCHEMSI
jgi:hypothetical protein